MGRARISKVIAGSTSILLAVTVVKYIKGNYTPR